MKSQAPSRWNYLLASAAIAVAFWGYWLRFCQAQTSAVESQIAALSEKTDLASRLALAALERTKHAVRYDPAYVALDYPGGDVPADTSVCTDVVIRSYRALGIDLQKLVHEDMAAGFSRYPQLWGLNRPDKNIDHRRVPNLQTFFTRHGKALEVSDSKENFQVGDLVAWDLNDRGLWHIGIVVGEDTFVHNIGSGPVLDRDLFQWKVIGHYRYQPE
ncbi:MAG: DUF1287 domain-containing protein [Verrucomicrobiae bacterium]|nr:DUF1287 domain-containing protein [Verrucomicrobiae bacterium]